MQAESIWLVIFGAAIALGIWLERKYVLNHHLKPWSPKFEAIARMLLMLASAAIIHATIVGTRENFIAFWFSVAASTFLMYGATHFFERILFK